MRTVLWVTVVATGLAGAGDALADPRGLWRTEGGKSHLRLADCENKPKQLCGTIVWMKNPRKDVKNDDESLRERHLVGARVVWDLEHQGGKKWDDGKIYNPSDGNTYSSDLVEVDASTVEVSGCVLFFCKEQTWKRIE